MFVMMGDAILLGSGAETTSLYLQDLQEKISFKHLTAI